MSRDSNGNYTLPSGNPVVAGTTILDTWANPTMTDLGTEITASLNRSGKGGMLAGLKGFAGTVSLPGFTFTGETSSGLYYPTAGNIGVTILGSNVASFEAGVMSVRSGSAAATLGPILKLHRESASPAVSDFIGAVFFDGEDDASAQVTYASIDAQIDDETAGTEDGTLLVKVMKAGTLTTLMDFSAAGIEITTDGNSDTNTKLGVGSGAALTTSTLNNTLIGNSAGAAQAGSSDDNNTWVGFNAGLVVNGSALGVNTGIGSKALDAMTTGLANTAVGVDSLSGLVTANSNTAVGSGCLKLNTVAQNTGLGEACLDANATGLRLVGVGFAAGGAQAGTTDDDNTWVGYQSGLIANGSGSGV